VRVALAVLLLVPLLTLGAILLVLRSDTGTAWLLDRVPGLDITAGQGSLLAEWRAEALHWRGYGITLELREPELAWSPSCLLHKQLCFDRLRANHIDLATAPASEAAPASPVRLPAIDIPLALRIADVRLGPFDLNGDRVWDRFELDGGGSGASWRLDRVHVRAGEIAVTASGRVETRNDWPLDLQVAATLPPPSGDAWRWHLDLTGSLDALRLNGHSEGYLDAEVNGQVAPLAPEIPARLRLTSRHFLAVDTLPPTLALNDLALEARGSVARGFRVTGQAALPGTRGPVALALSGRVDSREARDLTLELSSGDAGRATVAGRLAWSEALTAQLQLTLDRFPWFVLVPDMAEPAVDLQHLTAQLDWRDNRYQGQLQARTRGPLGEASVSATVAGDTASVRVSELTLASEAGALSGEGQARFDGPVSWQAALTLNGFNPGYWWPALSARLDGQVHTEGALAQDGPPRIRADWNLGGQWREQATEAVGTLTAEAGQWRVSGLNLRVGDNRVQGEGSLGQQLAGVLKLSLAQPGQLLPGLAGTLDARLTLAGRPEDPEASLSAHGHGLAWRDLAAIETLDLSAGLASGQVLDARLRANTLTLGDWSLASLSAAAQGRRDDHQLRLDLEHADGSLGLLFAGAFQPDWQGWRGQLKLGDIDLPEPGQHWALQAPAELVWQRGQPVRFGDHCWAWQQSTVCAGDQVLWPNPDIDYRIERFPAQALAPLLPDTLRWRSEINGRVQVSLNDDGPRGQVSLDAGAGVFQVLADGDWQALDYQTLTLDLSLRPDLASVNVEVAGRGLGQLSLQADVDPDSPDHRMNGAFRLQGLDLALAGVFTGLTEVAGEIQGQGRLSGPLLKPEVTGELSLQGGRVMDPTLPVPMEDIQLRLALSGYRADLEGRLRSNARSEARVRGSLDWSGVPEGRIAIQGSRLPFSLEPYAQLEIAPDLVLAFVGNDLNVTGEVAVPRGRIEIDSLPEQAVQVSEDEVIVGVEREAPTVRSLAMDVTVKVGEDQVSFAAFGIAGDLEGTLRIGDDMDTRGTLRLVNGSYEAYGQELELRTARLLFVGNLTQPYLEVEAVRQVDTVTAGLRVTGPVRSPSTEVFSDPDMPQSDALSYLILGRAPQSRGDEGQISRAALSLGLTQANKVTGALGEEFGIRQLILEAEGSGEQTSVVASGYLTEDLSVRYGVGIFEPITTVALRYDLGKYFYLEAASGLAASLDLFYTRDF
jgi:translocation and assembly module TamB